MDLKGALATMQLNALRNASWAKSGSYSTELNPLQEAQYRLWLHQNGIIETPDYDYRGFWLGVHNANPNAITGQAADGSMHFTDYYKTPYHDSFSNESMYALPTAPSWIPTFMNDNVLMSQDNKPLFIEGNWGGYRL